MASSDLPQSHKLHFEKCLHVFGSFVSPGPTRAQRSTPRPYQFLSAPLTPLNNPPTNACALVLASVHSSSLEELWRSSLEECWWRNIFTPHRIITGPLPPPPWIVAEPQQQGGAALCKWCCIPVDADDQMWWYWRCINLYSPPQPSIALNNPLDRTASTFNHHQQPSTALHHPEESSAHV